MTNVIHSRNSMYVKKASLFAAVLSQFLFACGGSTPESRTPETGALSASHANNEAQDVALPTAPCAEGDCDSAAQEVGENQISEANTSAEELSTQKSEAVADAKAEGSDLAVPDADKAPDPEVLAKERALAWKKSLRRGRVVFDKRCDFCHPSGDEDNGPKIRGIRWTTGKMIRQIRRGAGKMKPMPPSKISKSQMNDLMAYLSTMRAVRGVKRP